MTYCSGRHFLQIPGPTNVPDRILRATDRPTIDHRGSTFSQLALEVLEGIKTIFQTSQPVNIYPGSGTGAWQEILAANKEGFYPYTPATNLLYGLREAITMLREEGLPSVFAQHLRLAEATRHAVRSWGLAILCQNPEEYSNSLTAVVVLGGYDADKVRETILEHYNLSLGTGLGGLKGKVFRIGHLGDFNDLMLAGTLCGLQMGLTLAGIPHGDGLPAALDFLTNRQSAAVLAS